MNRFNTWALAGLGLALTVATASAQVSGDGFKVQQMTGVRSGGVVRSDSTYRLQSMNSDGSASVREVQPDAGYSLISPAFLSSAFLHTTGTPPTISNIKYVIADSSSVEDTQGYNRLGLLVYPTFDDSTGCVLMAYSVRIHGTASHDSATTYNLPKVRTMTAPSDTVGSFLDRTESAAVNDSSGTFPYERLIVLSHMNGPRGQFIPLTDRDGANIAGAKISIAWRHIRSYSAPSLAGFLRGQEVRAFVRADLVGRRD